MILQEMITTNFNIVNPGPKDTNELYIFISRKNEYS